ncbi:MAG: SPOR domain-containing protein [Pseudomonadota bacterium]
MLNMRKVLIISVLIMAGVIGPARASDEAYAALASRGLAPWPEAFLTELAFRQDPSGITSLDVPGYKVRLPRVIQAEMVVIAVPGRMLIVDVVKETGFLALSPQVTRGLQIGTAPVQMQILALRPTDPRPPAPSVQVSTTIPEQVPMPKPRARPSSISPETIEGGSTSPVDTTLTRAEVSPQIAPLSSAKEGGLALQAGYFRDASNARRFADTLKDLNLPIVIKEVTKSDGEVHWRILVGPFANGTAREVARARGGPSLENAYPVRLK